MAPELSPTQVESLLGTQNARNLVRLLEHYLNMYWGQQVLASIALILYEYITTLDEEVR